VGCGDGICAGLENASNCPADCPDVCGDGFCTGPEDPNTCLVDCPRTTIDIEGSVILGIVKGKSQFLPSGEGNGKLIARGFLDVHPPLDGANGWQKDLEEGLDPNDGNPPDEVIMRLRFFDGADLNERVDFTRAECSLKVREGFLVRLRCKSADNNKRALFKRHPLVPDLFRFAIRVKKLSLLPFTVDLVTVNLQNGPENRPDDIGNIVPCKIKSKTVSRIKCDEPAGF